MKRFLIAALLFLVPPGQFAHAQSTATVVLSCGSLPIAYKQGASRPITVDINGQSCISGTINATTAEKSTAAAPSYVEGTSNPLSGDLSGNLRVLDSAVLAAVQAAIPAGTARIGYVSDDPCTQLTKTNLAIGTATGTTQLVAPSGSTQVYVCSFSLISAATAVVNLVGGTGATCTTGTPVAMVGSTTAASGMSLAANGGLTFGNGGATAARTTTAGHGVCLIQSGTTALAGNITYVQQ